MPRTVAFEDGLPHGLEASDEVDWGLVLRHLTEKRASGSVAAELVEEGGWSVEGGVCHLLRIQIENVRGGLGCFSAEI